MGGTNDKPNIEVNLDLIVDGVRLKIENGKTSISGGSVRNTEVREKKLSKLGTDAARMNGLMLGVTIILTGLTLWSTSVISKWVFIVYVIFGLILLAWFLTGCKINFRKFFNRHNPTPSSTSTPL